VKTSTYEDHAAHHVHAGAEAAEKEDLVCGNHVLATGLGDFLSVFGSSKPASSLRVVYASDMRLHMLMPTSCPTPSQLFYIVTTHLLPGPQAVMLLVVTHVVRNAVLAHNPAAYCQYQARSGRVAALFGASGGFHSCGVDVPCHCEEWRVFLRDVRGSMGGLVGWSVS
jgi:hypothetical protein